jgi:NADPH2:quinone reductase
MTPEVPFGPLLFKAVKIDITLIYILPAPERKMAIARLNSALAAKALECPVQNVFPLRECARAHQDVEAGQRSGATLIETTHSIPR